MSRAQRIAALVEWSQAKDMPDRHSPRSPVATRHTVEAFLKQVARSGRRSEEGRQRGGRLVFALDATASRAPTWKQAMCIQAEMFHSVTDIGKLAIQLVYYRGLNECRASPWVTEDRALLSLMRRVRCAAGPTQIERILRHILAEAESNAGRTLNAAVFIGDCMEENIDSLVEVSGRLHSVGIPMLVFHEGSDPTAASVFRLIASVTRGAYCHFNPGSPHELRTLLTAAAVYAAGGKQALRDHGRSVGGHVLHLTQQMQQ